MKNIVVSGGSGGIGREICIKFAENGYNVIIGYKNSEEEAKKLESLLSSYGILAYAVCADVSTVNGAMFLIEKSSELLGDIDVLVNNAGISSFALVQDIEEEDYLNIMDTNFKSTVFLTKYAVKHMLRKKDGAIINISSMWGKVGSSMESLYSSSKAAVNTFTLSLAKELGISGIRVNAVAPGFVMTNMNKHLRDSDVKDIVDNTLLGKATDAMDIADGVYFLANAKSITGEILTVDGGYTL